jgi:hypothetical protein
VPAEKTPTRTVCRSCGKPMIFAHSAKNPEKAMPLDPDPVPDGNVYLDDAGGATVLAGKNLEAVRAEGRPLRKSHFATCPNGPAHRKGAK